MTLNDRYTMFVISLNGDIKKKLKTIVGGQT